MGGAEVIALRNTAEGGFFDSLTERLPGCGRVDATWPAHLFLRHSGLQSKVTTTQFQETRTDIADRLTFDLTILHSTFYE